MLAKLTSKNQLTLPKVITEAVGPAAYFEVQVTDGQIVLTPVRIQRSDAVRAKLSALGLAETSAFDAVAWARNDKPISARKRSTTPTAAKTGKAEKTREKKRAVLAKVMSEARAEPAKNGETRQKRSKLGKDTA
ncbi:AbrB/MazE/SpoVT family DNA-binding domain-containing protein [Ideonella margarita]|uniref:AbrB/MazE/SpoVT family DNA-binding domain-containing protein n=1 Tax=Ideonella margarita TaxID=2984191 RepID=A0ABU9C4P4_9BURK